MATVFSVLVSQMVKLQLILVFHIFIRLGFPEQQVEEPKSLSGEDSSVSLGVTGSSLRGKPSRSKQSHQDTSSGVAFDRTLSDDVASQDATKTSSTTKNFDSSVPFVVTHQMVFV